MDLVVKHKEGKLPFIGVVYSSKEEAIKKFPTDVHGVSVTVTENYGRISLSINQNGKQLLYQRMLEYDHKAYTAWRAYVHLGVNYGHCYLENGQLQVARNQEGKALIIKFDTFNQP